MKQMPLPCGLIAQLVEFGDPVVVAPPLRRTPVRRWGRNGHQWESCSCTDCNGRRDGRIPSGYSAPAPEGATA